MSDRVVLVTGAAHGLGEAYARHLATAGARVAVLDLDGDGARAVADEIGEPAVSHACDVTDPAQVATAVADVLSRWGRIDALVNNAGGALLPAAPFETFTPEQWQFVLGVNLTAPAICAAAVVPTMRAAGYGSIVNVSSTTVSQGRPVGLAPYLSAKAGIVGLTRVLARELGADGIRVNAIAPGYVPTTTPKKTYTDDARSALLQRMIDEQCLARTGTPQDLCGAVEFLCSAASEFVTGQVLNVDGGWAHG